MKYTFGKIENLIQEGIATKEMINFLKRTDLEHGRYELANSAFALVQEYSEKENPKLEAHNKYIDIQCILRGKEQIDVAPREELTVKTQYSEERDIVFFELKEEKHISLKMETGTYAIFFPEDAHRPCMNIEGDVLKVVFKIPV